MKKTLKRTLVVTLILVLSLTLFTACNSAKTGDEYLLAEYGMTFTSESTVYNGESQPIYVDVDSSLASGKDYSVTYTYEKDGTSYDEDQIINAGTYKVTATIEDGSDETYTLESTVTITPATVSFVVSDMYVRTGSNATAATTVFADTELLGSDTVSSVGLTWDVDDISSISAMSSVSEGIEIGVLMTDSDNYTLSVTKGTLYVLSYAEYTAVGTLEVDINSVNAYNEIFNELTYSENNSYASAALRILNAFADSSSYSEIQLNMLGSVDEETIQTNYNKAVARSSQGYDLSWDVEGEAEIIVPDAETALAIVYEMNDWSTDDSDNNYVSDEMGFYIDGDTEYYDRFYIDEAFVIDYSTRTSYDTYDTYEDSVKYSDYFYFIMKAFDDESYSISSVSVRSKEMAYSGYTGTVEYEGTTYWVYYLRVDATTLGALGTSSSIDVVVNTVENYYVSALDTNEVTGPDNNNISSISISPSSSSSVTVYSYPVTSGNECTGALEVGTEYTMSIYMKDGFALSSIMLGSYEIDGSEIVDNKYTFTVEEGMFDVDAGVSFGIYADTIKQYTVQVILDGRTITYSDGTYEGTYGSVSVDGLIAGSRIAYVLEGDTLDFTITPIDDYTVTALALSYSSGSDIDPTLTEASSVDIMEELSGYTFSLDVEYGNGVFEFNETESILQVNITFDPVFTFDVESDDVDFTMNTAGSFVSDYGTISFLDADLETLTEIAGGQDFVIYADLKDGYIISSIKVESTTVSQSFGTLLTEGYYDISTYASDIITYGESYYYYPTTSSVVTAGATAPSGTDGFYNASTFESKVDAGDAITVTITFDTYYEVEVYDATDQYTAMSWSTDNLYKLGNYYYMFGSQSSKNLSITIAYNDGESYNWSDYYSDLYADDYLYYVVYTITCEKEELWSYSKKGNSSSTTASTASIGFDDLMDLVSPGDLISIDVTYDWD